MKKTVLAIVGPTGVGKTRAAEEIRKSFGLPRPQDDRNQTGNVGLISVDSRQVYCGMDIGTGKDAKIFGTDLTKPDKLFSVADYCFIVKPYIQKLLDAGKLPVLVGGTGLYLKALIDGIDTIDVPQNPELRKELEKLSVGELQKELQKTTKSLDPRSFIIKRKLVAWDDKQESEDKCGMNNSDWMNPRRLVRKIEIEKYKTIVPLLHCSIAKELKYDNLLIVGLTSSLSQIQKNIERRVKDRLDKGLLAEIKGLVKIYGWNEVLRSTIAYREWENYFKGKATYEETVAKWTRDEVNYAKRQLTWFKKDKRIKWVKSNSFSCHDFCRAQFF